MTRRYIKSPIDELETLFKENLHNIQVLGELREELSFRATDRAKLLERQIVAVVNGTLPVGSKPPRPDRGDDQGELL